MLCPSTNRWYGLYSLHEKNKYISVKNNNLGISPLSYHQLLGWVGSGIYKINGNSIGHQPKRIDFMFVPVKNQQSTIPITCINRKNQLLIGERLSFNQHHFFCVCFSFSFCCIQSQVNHDMVKLSLSLSLSLSSSKIDRTNFQL